MHVAHQQRNVVARVSHEGIDEEITASSGNATVHFRQHALGGPGVAADATNVRLEWQGGRRNLSGVTLG